MRWLWNAYRKSLHRYPHTIQALQTGVLVGSGDLISQVFVEKHGLKNIHWTRTLQFFCVGTFYVGPLLSVWYRLLHNYLGSGGKTVALKKVALDQICFAPVCLAGFLVCVDTLQRKSFDETKKSFRDKYPDILIANYKLWPAVQLINFYFVPLHFQVLYAQMVALFWNTYICFKTRPDD